MRKADISHLVAHWKRLGIAPRLIEERALPFFAEADNLVVAEVDRDGKQHLLDPVAAQAWQLMKRHAASASVEIIVVSAFRSVAYQAELIARKLHAGCRLDEILRINAPPGCSEHHSGFAVDIGTRDSAALAGEFEQTQAFRWLTKNAAEHGFELSYPRANRWGYQFEPWHWCYRANLSDRFQ